ncbi:helix-turn-helix domain-containing protein [Oscillibacter sp. GMB15532]|uniref:helix-turn-helix domain-containing protein n=1 Tax=Oscillibacter sp. GMB15532 TaxID=3230022 RepID=UPI0034E029BA
MNFSEIGRQVRANRLHQGMTQEQLAERTGLSAPYISHIERAVKHPSLEALVRIAAALDLTLDRLLAGNQSADRYAYFSEVQALLEDCSPLERRVLRDVAATVKESLRQNLGAA